MYTKLLFILLLISGGVWAQVPTRLIYSQQSSVNSSDQLKAANLTGSFPVAGTALASDAGNFTQPNDLVFDPANNYIYVVDNKPATAGANPTPSGPILRYSYNPTNNTVSNRFVVVPGQLSITYQGLAFDATNKRLYFTQSSVTNSLDAISVVSVADGSNFAVTQLINGVSGNFTNLNDLVVDPANNFLYVADQFINTGAIIRFSISGSTLSNRTEIVAGAGAGTSLAYAGLALDVANDRLFFTQYKSTGLGTKNPEDAIRVVNSVKGTPSSPKTLIDGSTASFLYPTDLVLDRANDFIYVTDQATSGSIYRYTITGTGTETTAGNEATIIGAADASSSYSGVTLNGGFTTPNPVTLTSSTPADDAVGVSATTNITLNFSRAVNKGTGNFEIVRVSDNVVIETIDVTSNQVTGSGTTWTIDPATTLSAGTTYALRASSGIFRATDGGRYAGISDNTTLNFRTNATPTDITLGNSSVAENAAVNTTVGTFSTTDPDNGQTFTYSLVGGAGSDDNGSFNILGNTLRTSAVFNFETKNSYSIRVRTTDSGNPNLTFDKVFTISITNVNEPPIISAQSFSVNENASNGTVVGIVTASDPDVGTTLTYSIVGGNTGNAFIFTGNSLQVNNPAALDFETTPTFTLTVQVSDGTSSSSATVTVNVTNVNEPPTISAQTFSINENSANGTTVGTVVASDPDAGTTLTYSITGGNTNNAFAFSGSSLQVANSAALDFETTPTFTLTVQVSDGTSSSSATVTVNLTNVNEAPTVANAIPPQSATVGQNFTFDIPANTFTDPETPGSLSLTVTNLPDGLNFTAPATISGTPSTTVGSPFTVTVTATDPGNLSVNTTFTITVDLPAPMPVRLVRFSAEQLATGSVRLNWETSWEHNAAWFDVQRSDDAHEFIKIGRLQSTGESTATQSYSFLDEQTPAQTVYYRLRSVDKDGSFDYSKIVALEVKRTQLIVTVLGNPTQTKVRALVNSPSAQTLQIHLQTVSGQMVRQQTAQVSKGQTHLEVDVANLAAGLYELIINDSASRYVKRILIN